MLVAIDTELRRAVVVGWITKDRIKAAPINGTRFVPCHEIPVSDLRPTWELFQEKLREEKGWTS